MTVTPNYYEPYYEPQYTYYQSSRGFGKTKWMEELMENETHYGTVTYHFSKGGKVKERKATYQDFVDAWRHWQGDNRGAESDYEIDEEISWTIAIDWDEVVAIEWELN